MVDTCAAEFAAETPYYYSVFGSENEAAETKPQKKVLVLGSGPIRIGQGVEFDYCSVHCTWAFAKEGWETIIVNNNPETVSTDFDIADKLYFEPLTAEDVEISGGSDSDSFTSTWGRPKSQQGFQSWRYGQSSRAENVRRPVEKRPEQVPPRRPEPVPVRRAQVVPKRTDDADFVPTPILQLKAGQRIEHNRFGFGKILEISGNATDLKAKISFDDHGEKILILKYAKIRKLDIAD